MMKKTGPIYTERNDCQDCYKCLRHCPVKAIKIEGASASVIPDECIYCGNCVLVCPAGAKKVRDDLSGLRNALDAGKRIIACLAPSYVAEFPETEASVLIARFQQLGFFGVSETALGAELVSRETSRHLAGRPASVSIASCCTSVVRLVNRHYPGLTDLLVPVLSPMQAHARMLKEWYGNDVETAFFGPCIAKKCELDGETGSIDYVLTFQDLQMLFAEHPAGNEKGRTSLQPGFIPVAAGKGSFFPVDGGMIANLKERPTMMEAACMSFSGVRNIREVLDDLAVRKPEGGLFLELLMCEGGCIKGPGTFNKASVATKRREVINRTKIRRPSRPVSFLRPVDLSCGYKAITGEEAVLRPGDIENALNASGKFSADDEMNCGGCGYDSCRDFAAAMLRGKAERIMCVSYMRKVAQDKASVLLKKIPYGVVVVDESLKIVDSNRKFADILGGEAAGLFETVGNLEGADLKKLVFFHKLFQSVLLTGEEMIEHRLRGNGLFLYVSIFTIQPNKIVCGIIQDMQDPEMRKDVISHSARQVIRRNMDVVQQIAFLLGENASFTESMLNTIIESNDRDAHPGMKNGGL